MSNKKSPALLSRAEFRAWLEKNKQRGVGKAWQVCDCPLARFLAHKGFDGVQVYHQGAQIEQQFYPFPTWAREFAALADGERLSGTVIRGATGLRILDSIKD